MNEASDSVLTVVVNRHGLSTQIIDSVHRPSRSSMPHTLRNNVNKQMLASSSRQKHLRARQRCCGYNMAFSFMQGILHCCGVVGCGVVNCVKMVLARWHQQQPVRPSGPKAVRRRGLARAQTSMQQAQSVYQPTLRTCIHQTKRHS